MVARCTFNLLGAFAVASVLAAYFPAQAADQNECTEYQSGPASWYGRAFAGRTMANGERFNPTALTVAHRSLPFGSEILIHFNNRSVRAIVTDRGPYIHGRVVDLSEAAAERLGMRDRGVARVRITRCRDVLPVPPIAPDIPYQEVAQAPD